MAFPFQPDGSYAWGGFDVFLTLRAFFAELVFVGENCVELLVLPLY